LVEIDQKADRSQVKRGQIFGLMVSLSAILAGCVMAVVGSIYESTAGTIMGGIVGGGGLASIIVAFTLQRGSEGEDSNNKGADDSGDV
jgi:uncharacterized membrane protein